jgi:D-arabinose 1-dehydrogenase-like Zn-dependent alcohol dehydrogenase
MGLHVAALDVTEEKLALARSLGVEVAVDAFSQALELVRRRGTISLVGLPPGDFATPIFDVVLKRITLRGSIVGTREDLAEAIAFAAEGKVKTHIHTRPLEDINSVMTVLALTSFMVTRRLSVSQIAVRPRSNSSSLRSKHKFATPWAFRQPLSPADRNALPVHTGR